ncbi:MAG: phosphatase PAP2 family protein [Chitinophagaceae bacterium]|nr:phosphatase PAP2 family protein [Chitinophagaceae bacterium]
MLIFLQISILERLKEWDQWLFIQLNSVLTNSFFDVLMPFLRNGVNWAPLYLFLLVFVLLNFKAKGGWWVLLFIVTVSLTDMTGTYLFKHNFERLRPCGDPDFYYRVRLLVSQCSGGYSFTSNHAANHFGMATFIFITFYPFIKKWAWMAFAWAGLIAYAQIYVGVHYPADILAGSLIGLLIGTLTGKLFNNRYGFTIFDNQPTISP